VPNRIIELHDSEVAAITEVGSQIVVFFSHAYIHQSEGRPGWDPGSGWSQSAALVFSEAILEGELPEFPAEIWDGTLVVGGDRLNNQIPAPFVHAGEVALRLKVGLPEDLWIRGRGATLTLLGDAVYVEEFSGHAA